MCFHCCLGGGGRAAGGEEGRYLGVSTAIQEQSQSCLCPSGWISKFPLSQQCQVTNIQELPPSPDPKCRSNCATCTWYMWHSWSGIWGLEKEAIHCTTHYTSITNWNAQHMWDMWGGEVGTGCWRSKTIHLAGTRNISQRKLDFLISFVQHMHMCANCYYTCSRHFISEQTKTKKSKNHHVHTNYY